MTFPEGFWFGAGSSSSAAEGTAPASELGVWETDGRRRPSGEGAGFAAGHADDLAMFAGHGLRHLRVTLEWARIEPVPGQRDAQVIEHYRLVLQAARDAGVAVWGCLHDGTLPGWFSHDERGFPDARSRGYHWARHVEAIGELFGDLVHGWVPIYEPTRYATRGWLDGARPPGRTDDAEAFAAVVEATLLASVEAALRLRQDGQPVATAQWLVPVFPARADPDAPVTPDAEAMTTVVDQTLWRSWQRMIDEESLIVPGRPPVPVPGAREAFDVLGFTYRHALAVRGDGALLPYPQTLATGPDGQVPWAEGLGIVLHRLAEMFPNRPLLVAGVGMTTADEEARERFTRDVLATAEEAVAGGIPLRGLWWEQPVDPRGDGRPGPGLFAHDRAARPAADLLAAVALGGPVPS